MRLCPRGHENPRGSVACQECGSKDLSTPQPQRRLSARLLLASGSVILKTVLFFGSLLYLLALIHDVLRDPDTLLPDMLVGLAIGLLWLALVSIEDMLRPWRRRKRRRR
jgi:hypothetical protein